MKAWKVFDVDNEYGTVIVFAETASKAKKLCLYSDPFDDVDYVDLRVRRFKEYDQYYNPEGDPKIDWSNEEHRVRLVKEFGWRCIERIDSMCEECPAKQWCSEWEYMREEQDE